MAPMIVLGYDVLSWAQNGIHSSYQHHITRTKDFDFENLRIHVRSYEPHESTASRVASQSNKVK